MLIFSRCPYPCIPPSLSEIVNGKLENVCKLLANLFTFLALKVDVTKLKCDLFMNIYVQLCTMYVCV